MYLGSYAIDDVLPIWCATHLTTTGASADAAAAPTFRIYDGNTATPVATGTLAFLDSSNTTGLYAALVTLSTANGFAANKTYLVHIQATVGTIASAGNLSFQTTARVNAVALAGAAPNNLSAAQVRTEVNAEIVLQNLDHLLKTDGTIASVASDGSVIAQMVTKALAANFNRATMSTEGLLENAATEQTIWEYAGGAGRILSGADNLTTTGAAIKLNVQGEVEADVVKLVGDATSAQHLQRSASTMELVTVQASPPPTTTTFAGQAGLSAKDDQYKSRKLIALTGAMAKQLCGIVTYNGTTKVFTVTALTDPPVDGDTFQLI